jgi:hypothetical protein
LANFVLASKVPFLTKQTFHVKQLLMTLKLGVCMSVMKIWLTRCIDWANQIKLVGELDDWTPASPRKPMIQNTTAACADAGIHLHPSLYNGFDVPDAETRVRKGVRVKANSQLAHGVHVGDSDDTYAAAIEDVNILIDRVFKKTPSRVQIVNGVWRFSLVWHRIRIHL